MFTKNIQSLLHLSTLFFVSGFISFVVLYAITKSSKRFLSPLFLKAPKSPTNANLLGGLAFSASAFLGSIGVLTLFGNQINLSETSIFRYCFIPFLLVTIYGYIDDRIEIRARHKLFLQFISVMGLILPVTMQFYPESPLFLAGGVFFGLAYMNGCNLIDGADTLFAKIGISSSVGFFLVGALAHSIPVMALSVIAIASLAVFYFYNRQPARVYTGEIGVGLLGLFFLVQGIFLFQKLNPFSTDTLSVLSKILTVSYFPVAELAISFLRRLWAKKSPFRGDHLHFHHIVKNKYALSPLQIGSLMAFFNMVSIVGGLVLSYLIAPVLALVISVAFFCGIQLFVCGEHWKKARAQKEYNSLFLHLEQKPIHLINGKLIEESYERFRSESTEDKEEKVEKMAA